MSFLKMHLAYSIWLVMSGNGLVTTGLFDIMHLFCTKTQKGPKKARQKLKKEDPLCALWDTAIGTDV